MESEDGNNRIITNEKSELSIPIIRSESNLSSSSTISSASDSSDDPFAETPKSTKHSEKSQFELSDDNLPVSTLPSPLDDSVQSPQIQTMERSNEPSSSYRIPSSVFARTKSTAPVEWSVCSNESLFSIHMGNMSFSRDHLLLMGRSGELGIFKSGELVKPGDLKSGELFTPGNFKSGELFRIGDLKSIELCKPGHEASTSSQFKNYTSGDIGRRNNGNLSQGVGATEAAAFETMKEVIRENEADRSEGKSIHGKGSKKDANFSHRSNESGTSIKSFAFPILTGGSNKGSSKNGSARPLDHQEQHDLQPQPTSASKPDHAAGAQPTSWFSCFSCWPCRS